MSGTGDAGVHEITVKGAGSSQLTFTGALLAAASSAGPGRLRWAELALYRWDGGDSTPFVLHRVGRSRVYHAAPSPCVPTRTARAVEDSGLDPTAQPCPACRPPDLDALGPDSEIIPEKPWHAYHLCRSLDDVEEALWESMPAGERITELPLVCRKLLTRARLAAA